MATSRKSGRSASKNPLRRLFELSRYDLLLIGIPLGFALSLVGYLVFPITFLQAVGTGAVVGLLALVDALYLNPPAEPPSRRTS